MDNDINFSSLLISFISSEHEYTVSEELTDGAYYWRVRASNTAGTGLWSEEWSFILDGTSISLNKDGLPEQYALLQNYPNPFNPSSKITYAVPEGTKVKIVIYDILGVEVLDLVDEYHSPGIYTVTLNANNLSTGIYIYRMIADSFVETKKLMLLK